jgi:enoyl-CoA hydratase/carnithine racemase
VTDAALRFDVDGPVAWVTLDRPEVLNALDLRLLADLRGACDRVEATPDIRACVLTGAGRAFSVGADIALLRTAFDAGRRGALHGFLEAVNHTMARIEALPVPTVAAVNGLARAGGFELLLACDLAVAVADARLGDVHTAFGVMPGGGSTHRLPRRIGEQAAKELIWSSRWLSGSEAADIGLVLRAVPSDKSAMRRAAGRDSAAAAAIEAEEFVRYLDTAPGARSMIDRSLRGAD